MANLEVEFVIASHCRNNLMRKRQSIHQKKNGQNIQCSSQNQNTQTFRVLAAISLVQRVEP